MRQPVVVLGVLALSMFVGASSAGAREDDVPRNKIPKAVMDALLAKFPKATIKEAVKEREGADIVYDIELRQGGRKYEADIKEDGTFINYEKAIDAKELPKAVREAIEKLYPKAALKEIMEETEVNGRDEKLSAYEVVLKTVDKKSIEVRVSPGGEVLEDSEAGESD